MKKIFNIILVLVFITSCKHKPNEIIIGDIQTPCDVVNKRNLIYKEMISLKDGKDLKTFTKDKDSEEYKDFLNLFMVHDKLVELAEKKKFSISSYKSCEEWEEMLENCDKAFDNNVSN